MHLFSRKMKCCKLPELEYKSLTMKILACKQAQGMTNIGKWCTLECTQMIHQ